MARYARKKQKARESPRRVPLIRIRKARRKRRGDSHAPRGQRAHEEGHRFEDDDGDGGELKSFAGVGCRNDPGDDRENDETQYVVDDGGAENYLRLTSGDLSQIGEHSGGDADAGGAKGRADEDVNQSVVVGKHPSGYAPAEKEGGDHSQGCHQQTGGPDRHHLFDARLQADLEEKQDDTELREDGNALIGRYEVESAEPHQCQVAEENAGQELAQHRRLVHSLQQLAADHCGREHHHQSEQNRNHVILVAAAVVFLGMLALSRGRFASRRLLGRDRLEGLAE